MIPGLILTDITVPYPHGWLVLFYCSHCHTSTFLFNPWATKPRDGDYWRVMLCPDVPSHNYSPGWSHTPKISMATMQDALNAHLNRIALEER